MCELCNGSHVMHIQTSYSTKYQDCPVCGPYPDADARLVALYNRFFPTDYVNDIEEMKMRLSDCQTAFAG